MQRLAFGVEYDGSRFSGWQQQPTRRAVQSELKRALGTVADHPVDLICGGRTDAGVHARGQVVHADVTALRSLRAWLLGVNANLPDDLSVHWVWPVPTHFHARFSALARSYQYVILNRPTRSALAARRATCIHAPLDVAPMQQAAMHLLGEHDFSAYRAADCQSRSPVRRVERLEVSREGDRVVIDITANAFLHHMVRNIAGMLVEVGRGRAAPDRALDVLQSRDRRLNAATAPAEGLYLVGVHYPGAFGLPASPGVEGRCAIRYHRGSLVTEGKGAGMSWFEKIMPSRIKTERRTRSVPEGLWIKCPACDSVLYRAELERNLSVCPKCSHHMRIGARERLRRFLDPGTGTEIGAGVLPEDPLKFKDSKRYKDRLSAAQKGTGERDALIVLAGRLEGLDIVAAAFEFKFLGGSMGSVVGERFKRAVDHAIEHRKPLVCFCASGGARMQEALLSLLQMAKTSAALARLAQAQLPFISVLTDPTTGGVSASLAMLGDLNVAEPRALIGFAGPRVIQQTVRETLPEGFQRSEFLLEHGAIDMIVDRRDMRERLSQVLRMLLRLPPAESQPAVASESTSEADSPPAPDAARESPSGPQPESSATSDPT